MQWIENDEGDHNALGLSINGFVQKKIYTIHFVLILQGGALWDHITIYLQYCYWIDDDNSQSFNNHG